MSDAPSNSASPGGRPPIRLQVSYKTPEAVLTEFTRSVGKSVVALESRKKVPLGTRFIFELKAAGVEEPIEVHGEVVQVAPTERAKWRLTIRYDAGDNRKGLDALLQRIFDAHQKEKVRKHPRIPIQLRATEEAPYSPSYLVRDISRGGVGIEIESPKLPKQVYVGNAFLLELSLSLGTLSLHGEVAWVFAPQAERARWLNPSFGVHFGKLRVETVERLEKILHLKGLPPPPWHARVSFGLEAVSRMP